MVDGRYWVTYISEREHATGCDSVRMERVADTADVAAVLANEFMRNARDVMENDFSVTQCIVHIYNEDSGAFPFFRRLKRAERCGGLHWFTYDE